MSEESRYTKVAATMKAVQKKLDFYTILRCIYRCIGYPASPCAHSSFEYIGNKGQPTALFYPNWIGTGGCCWSCYHFSRVVLAAQLTTFDLERFPLE